MIKEIKPVSAQPGRPLYQTVKDYMRECIDAGIFRPGEQMPSTKELSEQLSVSLVTAHRALQELVACGVLHRAQGKGTFVHQRYLDKDRTVAECRIGLVFNSESSLADFYHSQILEGVRQSANNLAIDLVLLRFGEDIRNECNGFLYVNPLPEELEKFAGRANRRQPMIVLGAKSPNKAVCSIDVDNVDLAKQAVDYLTSMGHTRVAYVGGADQISNSRDRWQGFYDACVARSAKPQDGHILKGASWRLDEKEQTAMIRMLSGPRRPTAVFAAGYYFSLNVFSAAATVGLRIPEELSVIGVDDPPSAAHLSPALTTLRQPLVQLGHASVTAIYEYIQHDHQTLQSRELRAELVVRRSSGPLVTP